MMLSAIVVLALACGELDQAGPGGGGGPGAPASPYLGTTTSEDPPHPGGRMVYGLPAETNSWNPATGQWAAYSIQVARALYDPLYLFDADGNIQNNLVAKTEHNADFTEWKTTLRSGIKFHNGKPLTAEAVVRTGKIYRESPAVSSSYNLTTIVDSEALDELTFRTWSRKPLPMMRQSFTHQFAFVPDPDWLKSTPFQHDKPVGTGPFRIERWDVGKSLVVTRNPDYWRVDKWGTKLPYLDKIEFQVITNDQERANLLQEGKIDIMMQTLTTPGIATLREQCKAGRLQCFSDEKGETPENLVMLNTSKPPLNSLDARRALALAIDREDFVEKLTGGLNEPADSMYAPSSPWYAPTRYPGYDPVDAAKHVERVKVRNRGVFQFEMMAVATPEATNIAQYLQAAWRKVGIEVNIVNTDAQKKIINQATGNYQASLAQLFENTHPVGMSAYLDPGTTKPGDISFSFARLNDPEIGERIEGLIRGPAEAGAWRNATTKLVDRVNELIPYLWLDHAPRTIVARPNLVNVVQSNLPDGRLAMDFHLGSHPLAQIWIKR